MAGIVGSVGAAAIAVFGLDVARLHWDMTSISLFGAYSDAAEGFATPRFGHPKDRRTDLKQIQAGLAVTADGGVPVFHRAYDGGAGEIAQVTGAMESLRKLAGPRTFLMVGDSKLVSYPNLRAMIEAEVEFIAPASKTYVKATTLAAQHLLPSTEVDYIAERDQGKAPKLRGRWRVHEDTMTLTPPKGTKGPSLGLRRVFVWSSTRTGAAQVARTKKLDRARDDLGRLERGLGGRHYPNAQTVATRIAAIASGRRVTGYLHTTIGTHPATGKPTLSWHFDDIALAAEAATDGWYALLTNLDPNVADASEVLRRYKGQEVSERRYGNIKGPLAVAPPGWPAGMRIIVRREHPHPGAQLSLFEATDGWRYQALATNTRTGQLAFLEARHRAHARVEDRIRHAKDSGIGRFPSREFAINQAWTLLVAIAADLTAWTRLLGCTGEAAVLAACEPKALRYRFLHVPARLVHGARRRQLRIPKTWPWATAIVAVFANIAAIPQPA